MTIEELIKLYTSTAKNLRTVADMAEAQDPFADSLVARTSRAKAHVYESVVDDLEVFLMEQKGN